MRSPRYPLETLADLRARKVDSAVQGLAQAVAGREQAEAQRRERERQREAHEGEVARVTEAERGTLERGELCAADLARAHAWQLRTDAERTALGVEVTRAQSAEADARSAEDGAREQVAARRADADVVEKDRARFTSEARKRADAKEEESVAEAFRKRR